MAVRKFWSAPAPRGQDFWKNEVSYMQLEEHGAAISCLGGEPTFDLTSRGTFWFLYETYGKLVEKMETNLRQPVTYPKRVAVLLHWLSMKESVEWQYCV